jgi:hypothetical protein
MFLERFSPATDQEEHQQADKEKKRMAAEVNAE